MKRTLDSLFASDSDKFYTLMNEINQKRFAIKDIGISYRTLNHWDEKGLIPTSRIDESKWRKFSFVEYFWLKVIKDLREIGVPISTIQNLYSKWFEEDLFCCTISHDDKSACFLISSEYITTKANFRKNIKKDLRYVKTLKSFEIRQLEFVPTRIMIDLCRMIQNREARSLIINGLGESEIRHANQIGFLIDYRNSEGKSWRTYVHIRLFDIMKEFISKKNHQNLLSHLQLLSKGEIEVLKRLRADNLVNLTVRLKDRKIDLIEQTVKKQIDIESRFLDVIGKNTYQDIKFKSVKGTIVEFTNTLKTKIK